MLQTWKSNYELIIVKLDRYIMKAVASTFYWAAAMASFNMSPDKLLPSKDFRVQLKVKMYINQ